MKIILLSILMCFFAANAAAFAQDSAAGEYEACFDSLINENVSQYCLNIVLIEDGTYNLQLRNDNHYHTSVGTWKKDSDGIVLLPEHDPNYFDLHNDFIDKLIPERFLRIGEESLIWEIKTENRAVHRKLQKIKKCNC
jgi:hypothetical protein